MSRTKKNDLPKTGLKRMIENEMPAESKLSVSNHCFTVLHEAYQNVLNDIAGEMVKICDEKKRSTASAAIVLDAIKNLGFEEYEEELKAFCKDMGQKAAQKTNSKKKRWTQHSTDPEVIAEQERLFKEASDRLYGIKNTDTRSDNGNGVKDNQSNAEREMIHNNNSMGFSLRLPV